jgi:hypothetical protein
MLYGRGGQSAAFQRFSAAPVSNFGCITKLFMMHLCIKYPKSTSIIWSLCKKKWGKNFFAARNTIFEWNLAVSKKVWPPLLYGMKVSAIFTNNASKIVLVSKFCEVNGYFCCVTDFLSYFHFFLTIRIKLNKKISYFELRKFNLLKNLSKGK